MKSMAIPIHSILKISSQLFIEENYLFRNAIKCSNSNGGKYDPLSNQKNSHFYANRIVRSLSIAMLSLLGIGILVYFSLPAYAQDSLISENEEGQLNPPGNLSSSTDQSDIVLNTTSTDIPVVEKLSDKGTYIVQLRWSQAPSLLPEDGFDMEIIFLNASAPRATTQTFPTTETNQSEGSSAVGSTGYTDPSLIERMVPIKGYDIAIYSDDGRELWKKENQAVQGGRAFERVTLEEPYTGNITISIRNIEGAEGLSGTIAGPLSQTTSNLTSPMTNTSDSKNQTQSSESVNFSARVMGTSP
jgi:hypothetical protein